MSSGSIKIPSLVFAMKYPQKISSLYCALRLCQTLISFGSLLNNSIIWASMDNAAMELFFGRLKVESIYAEDFKTKQEAYSCVFEYIEMFYNRIRRHSYLNYVSPDTFEKQYYEIAA